MELCENVEGAEKFSRIRDLFNKLDLEKLSEIMDKNLYDLTDEQLEVVGLIRVLQVEGRMYCCKDIFGNNRYFSFDEHFSVFQPVKSDGTQWILNTGDLIAEVLIRWRLKGLGLKLLYNN